MIRGMLLLQISHFIGRLLFLLFSLWYLNRFLGVEAKGLWSGLYALMSILGVMANMGFEVWLTRAVAAEKIGAREAKRQLFRLKTTTWLIALTIGGIFVVKGHHHIGLALAFGVALILDGIGVSQQAVFEGLSQPKQMALMSFLKSGGFVFLVAVVVIFAGHQDLAVFGWLFVAALAFRVLYGWQCWQGLPKTRVYQGSPLRECLMMGAWTIATVVYFNIDGVMLLEMVGAMENGYYSNAYHFVEGSLFISAALGAMLYPRLIQAEKQYRGELFNRSFHLIIAISACGIIALYSIGPLLGKLLAGEVFQESLPSLYILAWCLPFMFANGLMGRWLLAHHMESFALKTALAGALINFVGNYLIIPHWGAAGAAVMTLVTEGLLFIVWVIFGRGYPKLLIFWSAMMAFCGLVVGLFMIWQRPVIAIFIGGCILAPLGLGLAKRLDSYSKGLLD